MSPQEILQQAIGYHQSGRLDEAAALYQQVLQHDPQNADALNLLGVIAGQQGRPLEAIGLLQRAISIHPAGPFYFNLAEAFRAARQFAQAIDAYQQAMQKQPPSAPLCYALGLCLDKAGRADAAISAQRQAAMLEPRFAPAQDELFSLLVRQRQFREAALACRAAIQADPQRAVLHARLGDVLSSAGDLTSALAAFQRALQLRSDWPEVCLILAQIYHQLHDWPQSAQFAGRAVQSDPRRADPHFLLAFAMEQMGQLSLAVDEYRQTLSLRPADQMARANLAGALLELRQFDESVAAYRQILSEEPAAYRAHSGLLLALNYLQGIDERQLFEEHKRWGALHVKPADEKADVHHKKRSAAPLSSGPIRIGYVSPDLHDHPVAFFIEGILGGHDRSHFRPIIFCDSERPDAVTDRLRRHIPASDWRQVDAQTDEQLAQQIRDDQIDILVDLAGHTGRHRLKVFSQRPAPITVTYLGYPNTTGLPPEMMQYRLTDAHCDPPGMTETLHTEQLVRLEDCFLCYRPPDDAPPVSPPPSESDGVITFGSFNAMQKVSPGIVELWSQILKELPRSRLALKHRTMGDAGAQEGVRRTFAAHGIRPDRLLLFPPQPTIASHLQLYGRIDIALDTFPYHGTTTSCDALWMGVPVVTQAGRGHRSRVGVSLLSNVGLQELIAEDQNQYVQTAVNLAHNAGRLRRLRAEIRDRMKQSPLVDSQKFVRKLENAYRSFLLDTDSRF